MWLVWDMTGEPPLPEKRRAVASNNFSWHNLGAPR